MKYFVIAGESSGDLHAANLIRQIKKLDEEAEIRGFGGDEMEKAGAKLSLHINQMDFMGFWEVIKNIRKIIGQISLCKKDILSFNPDVIIPVDYPGFNLRIAAFAKKRGFRVYYYISPQIWAWHQSRVRNIIRNVDKMFTILPFEQEFYRKWGFEAEYCGHPLLDVTEGDGPFSAYSGTGQSIALLPGSRPQEIKSMLPVMSAVAGNFPKEQFVVAALSKNGRAIYQGDFVSTNISVRYDQTREILRSSKAALVTSGTATLETALYEVPQAVCYKGGALSFFIAKKLVKVNYISLVNLILQKESVKEFIQEECTEKALTDHLNFLLNNKEAQSRLLKDYNILKEQLGGKGASERVARQMLSSLQASL